MRHEPMGSEQVRTSHEDSHAVYLEEERSALAILVCLFQRFLHKLYIPESDPLRSLV